MKFLLDTDTCIYALKQEGPVLAALLAHRREEVGISVLTEAELRLGAAKSASAIRTLRLLENFLRPLGIVEFTSEDALSYAQVRAKLERAGTPIGPLDIGSWIKTLLQGGPVVGPGTLQRFFAIHVFLLPAAILLLMYVHFRLIRQHGISEPL